jgi:hypothetical protein
MGRLAQLIRDLFSVKCSQRERLLRSDPMASTPQKLGTVVAVSYKKCPRGHFWSSGVRQRTLSLIAKSLFCAGALNADEPDVIAEEWGPYRDG